MPDLGLEVLWKGKNFARLLGGLWVALRISLISAGISVLAGILLGIAASRKRSVSSVVLRIWLSVIHVMPQMVLLFLMYFGTTRAFGWNLSGEAAAVIVFSLWGTAEMADLVRGAVTSIPVHQPGNAPRSRGNPESRPADYRSEPESQPERGVRCLSDRLCDVLSGLPAVKPGGEET